MIGSKFFLFCLFVVYFLACLVGVTFSGWNVVSTILFSARGMEVVPGGGGGGGVTINRREVTLVKARCGRMRKESQAMKGK